MRLALLAIAGLFVASLGLYLEGAFLAHRMGPEEDTGSESAADTSHVSTASTALVPILDELGHPLGIVPIVGASWLNPPGPDHGGNSDAPRVPYWLQAVAVELILGAIFLGLGLKFHNGSHLIIACVYGALLFEMAVIDFHSRLVLNLISFPSAVIAIVGTSLWSGIGLGSSLLGGAVALALFAVIEILGRGAMGRGDTKLSVVIGLMRGFPAVLSAIIAGILIGGLMALTLLVSGRGRRSTFAYGPALAIGGVVSLFAGRT